MLTLQQHGDLSINKASIFRKIKDGWRMNDERDQGWRNHQEQGTSDQQRIGRDKTPTTSDEAPKKLIEALKTG